MAVFDLFSKRRRRREQSGQPDVYKYDDLPQPLRVQTAHILNDALGDIVPYGNVGASERWQIIHDTMAREKGLFSLGEQQYDPHYQKLCINWFLRCSVSDALDFIEVAFKLAVVVGAELNVYGRQQWGIKVEPADAIEELNIRFREHGVGYQFEGLQLLRVDDQFVHSEVVKPALQLLAGKPFATASEEFYTAHQHYRDGKFKDAIVAAQRAFESTLKAICTIKSWKYQKGDRSSELIKLVRANGLFPSYLGPGFDSYIAMMKTGLPEVRNNAGGHGSDPGAAAPPAYVAAYALHMTATNIVLLGDAAKLMPK